MISMIQNILIIPTLGLYYLFGVVNIFIMIHGYAARHSGNYWLMPVHYIGDILVALFIVLDVIYDCTVGSLWFLKLPEWNHRDKTFTGRLKYYQGSLKYVDTWRYRLAKRFCSWINVIQKNHC